MLQFIKEAATPGLIVDHAPTVCAISVGSILNATCDKSALKDKMSVDKHIGSIGHCLFIHSANCSETAQRVDSLRSFVCKFGMKHGRPGLTHRNFVAVMIVDLSHQLHQIALF